MMFFSFFFVYNAPEITVTDDLVALLPQQIALVFIGRFRCGLQFFRGRKAISSERNRFGGNRVTHVGVRERMKCDVFHFFYFLFLYITLLRLPLPMT